MKLSRTFSFLSPLVFTAALLTPSLAQDASLEVQLAAEDPTSLFYDRDTLGPQTPILFTARVANPSSEERQVALTWRVTGGDGKVRWEKGARFSIGAKDSIIRRELFDPPARGGYLLQVNALAKVKGPDLSATADLPFAVAISPAPSSATSARPQSFFVLSAPGTLTENQLDFYARLGARVLRSALPADPSKPDWPGMEAQLAARVRRNLASIALLPIGEAEGRSSETYFARQVPTTLARQGSLTTWELAGDVTPADLDGWSQISKARRNDISLLGPLPGVLPQLAPTVGASFTIRALDGATFQWPAGDSHPAALKRQWLSRARTTRESGLNAFHLRRDLDLALGAASGDQAAGEMTADFLTAIMAGASSMSEVLRPPASGAVGARSMAQAAAFAMMTRTLEDAIYREELFPQLPGLQGALFRVPRGSIAVLYSTAGAGKLSARVSPARAFDIYGNAVGQTDTGSIEFPLNGQPVYVLADVPADVLSFALRDAHMDGFEPLAAQILPISTEPGAGEKTGGFPIMVRLQNINLGSKTGQLTLEEPSGWKFARKRQEYRLNPGETKTYEFRVERSRPIVGKVRMNLSATHGSTRKVWNQDVAVATAQNVTPGKSPRLDGDLADWEGAQWMEVGASGAAVSARLAMRWDGNRLFLAAQVKEPGLTARRADDPAYEFWKGHDAIQFAFGTRDTADSVPGQAAFRDSDHAFILSPFNHRATNQYDGRVLRLWDEAKPYNMVQDRIRWAGAVPGASCVIVRDEKSGVTSYEARLPLNAIPELQPLEFAGSNKTVRFGWLLHNDEGATLDWGRQSGNFPWWENTSTFLPEGQLTSALRSSLGFTLVGDVDLGLDPRPAPRNTIVPTPGPPPTLPGSRPLKPSLGPSTTRPVPSGSIAPPPANRTPPPAAVRAPTQPGAASGRVAPRPPGIAPKPVVPATAGNLPPLVPPGFWDPTQPGATRGAVPAAPLSLPQSKPVDAPRQVAPPRPVPFPASPGAPAPKVAPWRPGGTHAPSIVAPGTVPPPPPAYVAPPVSGRDLAPGELAPLPPAALAPAAPTAYQVPPPVLVIPSRIRMLPMPSQAPPRAHLMPPAVN